MAAFNKVLNILIFLLAIVALVFGYLLYERRNELRQRGDMLAKTVADVTSTLDRDSGTKYSDGVHVNPLPDPIDPTKQWGLGTLGWENFHAKKDAAGGFGDFKLILDKVSTQAREIQEQRNFLGDALVSVSGTLEKEMDAASFQTVSDKGYEAPVTELNEYVKKVHDREMTIMQNIEAAALSISHPIEKDILKNFDDYERVLGDFGTNVENLNKRAGDYADTLSKAPTVITEYDFQMNQDRVKTETDYQNELNQLLTDFAGINEKLNELARTKIQLEETKKQLEEYITALEDAQDNIKTLETRLANIEAQLEIVQRNLEICESRTGSDKNPTLTSNGKVVKVNYEHNYVIINIGARNNLVPNVELKVARDKEFICKIYVSRVMDDFAVCEILPDLRQGMVVEGDRVIQ